MRAMRQLEAFRKDFGLERTWKPTQSLVHLGNQGLDLGELRRREPLLSPLPRRLQRELPAGQVADQMPRSGEEIAMAVCLFGVIRRKSHPKPVHGALVW